MVVKGLMTVDLDETKEGSGSDIEIIEQARPAARRKQSHMRNGIDKRLRCRNCDGAGHYQGSCPMPRRDRPSFCHICGALGHDSLLCKLRNVSCRRCGKYGHEEGICQTQGDVHDDFWERETEPCTYKRIVSVEEALNQSQADIDAIMQVEPKEKLLELARLRRLPMVGQQSVMELLRSVHRQLCEFYAAEKLYEKP